MSYPLSEIQKGMVFHTLQYPGSGLYIQQLIGNFHEELDISAFSWAITRLLQRYANLRIHITFGQQGHPIQVVNQKVAIRLKQRKWDRFRSASQDEKFEAFLEKDRQEGFTLEQAPLMRMTLFRLADRHYKFVWTSHHLLFDGHSRVILLKELFALYQSKRQGHPPELPNPPSFWPFIDWLSSQDFNAHKNVWQSRLQGFQAPTPLTLEVPQTSSPPPEKVCTYSFSCSQTFTAQLVNLCDTTATTLNTLLLASWAFILSRYSGQSEVVFGVTRAGRSCPVQGMTNIVGLCINTLPIRIAVPSQLLLPEWLKMVRSEWMSLRDLEQTPLASIQQWSEVAQGDSLFDTLVVFDHHTLNESLHMQDQTWPNGDFQVRGMTNYPLVISGFGGKQLNIDFSYYQHRFTQASIERLSQHFHEVLTAFANPSHSTLGAISLLSSKEHQQIVIDWNNTQSNAPKSRCIHELFEVQTAKTPEAIAVEYDGVHLSYAKLNQQANRLAAHLIAIGIKPETSVGLLMERSPDLIVCLMGILKAGGSYLPLDPAYPEERIRYMLENSRAPVLIIHTPTLRMVSGDSIHVLNFDNYHSWRGDTNKESCNPINTHVQEKNLAYILYTSGSTGRPKGVAIEHRNVVNFLYWVKNQFTANEYEGILASTSICFDLSVFEIFGPLSWGGTVVLVKNALHLQGLPTTDRITLINTVPSAISALLQAHAIPSSVQVINLAGEPLTTSLVTSLYEKTRVSKVYDLYGPSEATTYATGALRHPDAPSTIGRPLLNTQTFVLDSNQHPLPVLIPGELFIGGDGLARGYWQQPSLTAEKFVPDNIGPDLGDRLYRTGDRVRQRPNGELEFLGRIDHQVKIRGHRIELGEIREVLNQHEQVQESIVIVRFDVGTDPEFVAYVVGTPKVEHTGTCTLRRKELQAFLGTQLPSFMIPGIFVFLEALPLTPNGKIDRKALPVPTEIPSTETSPFVAPRTRVESLLAEMWAHILRIEQVGTTDNFFHLGGHSLLAMQIVARVRTLLNVELPLQTLFDTPTIGAVADVISQLNPEVHDDIEPVLGNIPRPTPLPLSYAQERLWFLDRWEPNSPLYNMAVAYRLHGSLDVKKWERALQTLITRHETLRTTFIEHEGIPAQCIQHEMSIPLTFINLIKEDSGYRAQKASDVAFAESRCPFDLATGPLVRATLIHLEDHAYLFLLTLHHIISDGWSLELFFRELLQCYEANLSQQDLTLPALPIQYADFALWQREWLQGKRLNQHLMYWRNQLGDAPPTLEIPTDHPRPPRPSYHGYRQPVAFSADLAQALQEVSEREGVTLFMVMLAAFQVLLARYSGQMDIVVGTPIANRSQEEVEPVHGFFANTLVLRTNLSGHPTFQEILQRVRNVCLGAYAHQDVPFEKLVEELQPERDLSRNPLFQVMFQLYTPHDSGVTIPNLTVSRQILDSGTAKFDLLFSLGDRGTGLYGGIEYATDLFEEATISRLIGHYQRLLEEIISDSSRPIDQLPLLTPREQSELLVDWNSTQAGFPQHSCLHELIEEQANKTPDSIAVMHEEQFLTYAQLNARANELATHFRALGVTPDSRVGLCLERSINMIIGVLAILKAGGTYVPLDPTYPPPRLNFMLENADVHLLVTQREFQNVFATTKAHVFLLHESHFSVQGNGEPVKGFRATPANMAYVIYTSGSTGQPKGVAMTHQALVNLISWQGLHSTVPTDARTLQFTSLNFDVSAQEIFSTLAAGGTLVLISEAQRKEPVDLLKSLLTWQIERLFLPVVALQQLAEIADSWELFPTHIHEIITAGEALQITPTLRTFFDKLPNCTLHNQYGPTETHVSTAWTLQGQCQTWPDRPPIGFPIANENAYILDNFLQPVPIGMSGELYLGGIGIARGYINRSDLTAERFAPNPFSLTAGERIYKTGDVVRYRANGVIEFIGRVDHQIKLRGYRIEVGEIEVALEQHAQVSKAVVVMDEHEDQQKLIAYVVSIPTNSTLDSGELQQFLDGRMPAYMVPTTWIVLDSLPLTATGKINRRALPAPTCLTQSSDHFVPTETHEEKLIADIWKEVLKIERAGCHDNFFALGGHSLLGMKVISRVRKVFGVELPIRELFENPTVSTLTATVEKKKAKDSAVIRPYLKTRYMPLSVAQERLWMLHESEPDSYEYNISSVVRVNGLLQYSALYHALVDLIARHETLRTRFDSLKGHQVQIIEPLGKVDLTFHDLLTDHPTIDRMVQAKHIIQQSTTRRFDLQQVSLFRIVIVKVEAQVHLLSLTIHHIISDGWSVNVFWKELGDSYTSHVEKCPSSLPVLPLQYTDFVMWQREKLQGNEWRPQMDYWHKQLDDLRPLLPILPIQNSVELSEHTQSSPTAWHSITLSSEISQALKALCHQQGVTPFVLTLALWNMLVARHLRQTEIILGTPISGRTHQEFEGLIGMFVNILVLRTHVPEDLRFTQLLDRVHQVFLDGYANQNIPLGTLLEKLQKDRKQVFDVWFNFSNPSLPPTSFSGLTVSSEPCATGQAKYALALYITDELEGFHLKFLSKTENYSHECLGTLSCHFQELISQILENQGKTLATYVLSPSYEKQILPDSRLISHKPHPISRTDINSTELQFSLNQSNRETKTPTDDQGIGCSTPRDLSSIANPSPPIPLSFAQERLWFLDQWEPHSALYNVATVFRLRGPLHLDAFRQALQALIHRHDSLRTTFQMVGDTPCQYIHRQADLAPFPLPLLEVPDDSPNTRDATLQQMIGEETRRPFELTQWPLFRVQLLRVNETERIFILTMHHIITDGWSLEIVLKELAELYTAACTGKPAALPPLPRQYADYAVWQRNWLQGEVLENQLAYWRNQLEGAPPLIELPTDYSRPAVPSYRGAKHHFVLTAELTGQLRTLSHQQGGSLFMTLLAAFQVFLARYTGQPDIVVGSPIANRTHEQSEGLIGFLVNTVLFRTQLRGNPSFREVLTHVKHVCLDAYAHQDLPFEKLVEELQPERNPGLNPLFQVVLQLQNTDAQTFTLPGLEIERLPNISGLSKFDLNLFFIENGQELHGIVDYSTDLFAASTVTRMMTHFQRLMQAVVEQPEQPVFTIELLTEVERHQQLVEWNNTSTPSPSEVCIHQLFEVQVARTPDAIAVVFEGTHLSYAELEARTNQLAQYLHHLGVQRGMLVGILAERSLEMVIALYATLKAGAAYVPLDPTYPAERVLFMLQDSQVAVLLTQAHLRPQVPLYDGPVVTLETAWGHIENHARTRLAVPGNPEDLAYMIYTSGSTGQPKGAMNTHRGIGNRLHWMQAAYDLHAEDRVLQKTPFSFDVSVWELFWPLLTGARLVLATPEGHRDSRYLRNVILQETITTLHFVPSMLQSFLQESDVEACRPIVRQVFSSGEALSGNVQALFFQRLPGVALHNLYGPTEAAVDVTAWPCQPEAANASVPIGRPIANIQIHLFDRHKQVVPIGVLGELHIGGVGLARGYHRRPDLTAEKFIPDPLSLHGGSRVYKTGDLARYRPDGTIDYVGRLDHQIKLRGYRIELGEIETALRQHPSIQDTVVLCREDRPGEKQLVAYLVGQASARDLRPYLHDRFPDYMVPSAFVVLEQLPLTPNGKVDRQALPPPSPDDRHLDQIYVAPRTPNETALVGIWQEVLALERVGIHDNFFDLGGHSLMATILVSRIRTLMQFNVSIRNIFDCPTIAQLADYIKDRQSPANEAQSPPLATQTHDGLIPLSFAQQRLWFLDQWEPNSALYNMPFIFNLRGPLKIDAFRNALRALVKRHESLRTTFQVIDDTPYQYIQSLEELPSSHLSIIEPPDLINESRDGTIQRIIIEEIRQPFNLTQGPLFRLRLLPLAAEETIFILTMHHIISDGWSIEIFLKEFSQFYEAEVTGIRANLPALPMQLADYTIWQRDWFQGNVLTKQLTYWKKQLDGAPRVIELTTDYARPAVPTHRGAKHHFILSKDLTQHLQALSRQHRVSLFMSLLGIFQVFLARYTNQTDIVVGSPIANRTHEKSEGIIGFLVNTLLFRIQFDRHLNFGQVLERVRNICLDAYAHQDLPFEKLVEELQPERDPSRNPLFQVMMQLQKDDTQSLVLPELEIERLPYIGGLVKFDLNLIFMEVGKCLKGTVDYSTDLFTENSITRMMVHFQRLLRNILANPEQSVFAIQLLDNAERQQLVEEWNTTTTPYPKEACIHRLFEAQVARTPDAIAVVFGEEQLTYAQLNKRANQLAHYLRRAGVGPEVRVGVCLERSVDFIVSLWGILKAEGGYVPLDPQYPTARLLFMIEDARVAFIVTTARVQEAVLPAVASRMIFLETLPSQLMWESSDNPTGPSHPQHLAYLIYTSGSSGRPKGVMVAHLGLGNVVREQHRHFHSGPDSRVLQFASISFDASLFEIIMALAVGGTLILESTDALRPGPPLISTLRQYGITLATFPPSLLAVMAPENLPALTTLLVAGEHCPDIIIQTWSPGRRFLNLYGPTEGTIWSTAATFHGTNKQPTSLGWPIDCTSLYILDAHGELVPLGLPGEAVLGGIGLARGYLNHPTLTAQQFVPNPFSQIPGARLYKTGDRVRYLGDHGLGYLGRLDHQVKLRGYRIEVGEIEMRLREQSAVQDAVVICREDNPGTQQLVAYVVVPPQGTLSSSTMREALQPLLPDYMIPTALVVLEQLPLTPNGKIDRRALPAPTAWDRLQSETYEKPRTPTEEILAAIWQEVLGIEQVSIHDNFFELGGHSLLATKLISRVRKVLGAELYIRDLFAAPTLKAFAEMLAHLKIPLSNEKSSDDQQRFMSKQQYLSKPQAVASNQPRKNMEIGRNGHVDSSKAGMPLICLQPTGNRPPLIYIHPIGGGVSCYQKLVPYLEKEWPVYAIQAIDFLPTFVDDPSLEELAGHYIRSIQSLDPKGPYYLGGWSFGGVMAYEMARQLKEMGHRVQALTLIDSFLPNETSRAAITNQKTLIDQFWRNLTNGENLNFSEVGLEFPFLHSNLEKTFSALFESGLKQKLLSLGMEVSHLSKLWQIFISLFKAYTQYSPKPYSGKIQLLQASDHSLAVKTQAKKKWNLLAKDGVEVIPIPGNHYSIFQPPFIESLASGLQLCLRDGVANSGNRAPESLAYGVTTNPDYSASVAMKSQDTSNLLQDLPQEFHIEHRSLSILIEEGKIPPVDSIALYYLPDQYLLESGLTRDTIIHDWYHDQPTLTHILDTSIGRVGFLMLPLTGLELYSEQKKLIELSQDALTIAAKAGATTASLTGLLPSATDYGLAIQNVIGDRAGFPSITTGHGTTAATVVLATRKILQESQRAIQSECVGFLGLGSIGLASLRLMLNCLPHPQELLLCDMYHRKGILETIRQEILFTQGFQGNIRIIESTGAVPHSFYDSKLIIGATNVPDVLDVERLKPGTLIVDDSGPHCFQVSKALERSVRHEDILFTEGGILQSPTTIPCLRFLPPQAMSHITPGLMKLFSRFHYRRITGCVLASLLLAKVENQKPVFGLVDVQTGIDNFNILLKLGYDAAELNCDGYTLPTSLINKVAILP